jgi:hypothetical protein
MTDPEERPELGFNPHKCGKRIGGPSGPPTNTQTSQQLRDTPRAGLTSADRIRKSETHLVLLVERPAAKSTVPVDYTLPYDATVKGRRHQPEPSRKTGLVSDMPAQAVTRVVRPQSSQIAISDGVVVGAPVAKAGMTPSPQASPQDRKATEQLSKIFAPPPRVVVDTTYRPEAPFYTGQDFS